MEVLSSTERQILEQAREHGRRAISAEMGSGTGPKGGIYSFGSRRYKAVKSLVEKGLATNMRQSSSPVQGFSGSGGWSYIIQADIV